MDKIKVFVRGGEPTCATFAYGRGGNIYLPDFVAFTGDDAVAVTNLINEALANLPVEFVPDEFAEWERRSKS